MNIIFGSLEALCSAIEVSWLHRTNFGYNRTNFGKFFLSDDHPQFSCSFAKAVASLHHFEHLLSIRINLSTLW